MLRKTFAFDHCQKVDVLAATTGIVAYDWYTNSGYSISLPAPYNVPPVMNSVISLDGWLAFQINTALTAGASPYTLLNVNAGPSAATKVVFGARIRSWQTFNNTAYSVMAFYSANTNEQILLGYDELVTIRGASPSPFEFYVEVILDLTLNTREVWVNGALWKTTTLTLNAANKAAVANGTYQLMLRQSLWTGQPSTNWQRDIYVLDDVPGDGFVGRLGPQKLIPLYIDQATGSWVSDDGLTDLKATLNAPYPAGATLVSPATKDPLTLSLNAAIPDGYKVNGVSLWMGGKSLGDIPSNAKVEIKQGGQTLAPVVIAVPRALSYGQQIAQLGAAPDGGVWTAAKLDQTTLVITPDQ